MPAIESPVGVDNTPERRVGPYRRCENSAIAHELFIYSDWIGKIKVFFVDRSNGGRTEKGLSFQPDEAEEIARDLLAAARLTREAEEARNDG